MSLCLQVFVGRPAVWGLSCAGEEGVKKVLKILAEEFQQAMALSGDLILRHNHNN